MSKLGILGLVTAPLLAGVGIGYALPRASSAPDTAPKEKPPQAAIDELYLIRQRIIEHLKYSTECFDRVTRLCEEGKKFDVWMEEALKDSGSCGEMHAELARRLSVLSERYGFDDPKLRPPIDGTAENKAAFERARSAMEGARHGDHR